MIWSTDLSLSRSSTNCGPASDQHQTATSACAQPCGKTVWQGHLHRRSAAERLLHQVYTMHTFSQLFNLAASLLAWCTTYTTVIICVPLIFFFCSFPNLGILHVTKKNVSKVLEERMTEAYRLGYNHGVVIHPEIDSFQGETRLPRELTGNPESVSVCVCAL